MKTPLLDEVRIPLYVVDVPTEACVRCAPVEELQLTRRWEHLVEVGELLNGLWVEHQCG